MTAVVSGSAPSATDPSASPPQVENVKSAPAELIVPAGDNAARESVSPQLVAPVDGAPQRPTPTDQVAPVAEGAPQKPVSTDQATPVAEEPASTDQADRAAQKPASTDQTPPGAEGAVHNSEPMSTLQKITQSFGMSGGSTSGADECLTYEQLLRLRTKVRDAKDVADEISDELSAAIDLAERIRFKNLFIPGAGDQLEFIVDCLLMEKPKLIVARDERVRLQLEFYRRAGGIGRLLAGLSAGSSAGLVLAALFLSLILWTLLVAGVRWLVDHNVFAVSKDIFFMNGRALLVITSAAFIGGVVSIATRLREFSRVKDLDPFAMFWTALLKPLIGVILSLFILAALAGGVVSIGILDKSSFDALDPSAIRTLTEKLQNDAPHANEMITSTIDSVIVAARALYILWVVGFLAGFSERFAWDFVDRAQGVTMASNKKEQPSG